MTNELTSFKTFSALEASKTRLLGLSRYNALGTLSNTGDGAYIRRFHFFQGVLITRRRVAALSNGLIGLIVHELGAKTCDGIPLPYPPQVWPAVLVGSQWRTAQRSSVGWRVSAVEHLSPSPITPSPSSHLVLNRIHAQPFLTPLPASTRHHRIVLIGASMTSVSEGPSVPSTSVRFRGG